MVFLNKLFSTQTQAPVRLKRQKKLEESLQGSANVALQNFSALGPIPRAKSALVDVIWRDEAAGVEHVERALDSHGLDLVPTLEQLPLGDP